MTMHRGAPLSLLAVALTCAAAKPKPAGSEGSSAANAPAPTPAPVFSVADCGAGHLPRINEATLDGGLRAFLAAAAGGTVPVVWDGKRARLVDACHLDGHYTEAVGTTPGARFFATNRVLLRTDEVGAPCRVATHVVAAYVTSRAGSVTPGDGGVVPSRLDGILVPLPCPPTSDRSPAPGCVGVGLTGAQRREKAAGLMANLDPEAARAADATRPLELFALVPDEFDGLRYAMQAGDCALMSQGRWVSGQYLFTGDESTSHAKLRDHDRRDAPPRLDCRPEQMSCSEKPVFLTCFGERFQPRFARAGDWMCPPRSGP